MGTGAFWRMEIEGIDTNKLASGLLKKEVKVGSVNPGKQRVSANRDIHTEYSAHKYQIYNCGGRTSVPSFTILVCSISDLPALYRGR